MGAGPGHRGHVDLVSGTAYRCDRAYPGRAGWANAKYAPVEQVKKFFILDHDLAQRTPTLTPTLKVERNVVQEKYSERFDALYG